MDPLPNDTSALAPDFRDAIEALNAQHVAFILVGGFAVGWHGVVRATGDIDFLYEQSPKNVRRLCKALEAFGAPEHLVDADFLLSPNALTQLGNEPLRIDLLASISGVSYEEVRAGAEEAGVGGQRLLIIGLDELRKNKRASGRPRDKEDLRRLGLAAKVSRKRGRR
ncbi:MAG: nucleotidyltransferase [Gemmatimonadetes bacterium]|nr:nucleotidyltransferase [Gemmatimonadota bacterium]MCC6774245.1 nucleotidyltransferase [Gemmatimonadaceae bacterium]